MKKTLIALSALALTGCASMERPQVHVVPKKAPIVAPVVTPNDQVKHRWYDKFKHHPKFFH